MKKTTFLLPLTVMIWGSLYVFSRIVLTQMPAIVLLFFRFAVSSVLLLGAAKIRHAGRIRREDCREILVIGFLGYFVSNACLLLGVQYAGASFSSLINAMTPIVVSLLAVWLLSERMSRKAALGLIVSVAGAAVVIGAPSGNTSVLGILFCLLSVLLWSYVTIRIKKLTAKYDPILVTGAGMGVAAVLSLPASVLFLTLTHTSLHLSVSILLPLAYICIICTAVSHLIWNYALSHTNATQCVTWYPLQPITSMLLGILFLGERLTLNFIIGAAFIVLAMVLQALPSLHLAPFTHKRKKANAHGHAAAHA